MKRRDKMAPLPARVHGALAILETKIVTALDAADVVTDERAKAALRGKAAGYRDAARLLQALERGTKMPWRRGGRWAKRNLYTRDEQRGDQ